MEEYKEADFWGYSKRIINETEYKLSEQSENIQLLVYSTLSFFVPLLLKQPQVLVGTFVNMMIILSALNLRGKNILPVIFFPSIAVAVGGYIFGGLTAYFLYLIPFIWLGNAALLLAFKYFNLNKKMGYFSTLGIGAAAKTALIFGATFALVYFSVVPESFLVAMGAMQLVTAVTGGLLAFTVQRAIRS